MCVYFLTFKNMNRQNTIQVNWKPIVITVLKNEPKQNNGNTDCLKCMERTKEWLDKCFSTGCFERQF